MKYLSLVVLAALCCFTGCVRPYDTPEFVEVQHHETAYLIPLEGANQEEQTKFDSEDYLEKNRVAIKRIQIPHRWVQTGRMWFSGNYMDTVRVVVVNRQPVSASWTADENSGNSSKNDAIWLQSADSISFSLGFTCTAFIDEKDTSKFLYMYPTTVPQAVAEDEKITVDMSSAGLNHVMNKEIRNRIQTLANIVAARFDLDYLRREKDQILYAVRNGIPEKVNPETGAIEQDALEGVISHFAKRGITITDLGMFGGFEYDAKAIQEAINETFVAQQEKVRTEAAFEAQAKKNERIELEAKATANKQREIALGSADAIRIEAEAKAASIKLVADAAKAAGQDPLFLELKKLEVENERVEKWDGKYPNYLMNLGGGASPNLLLELPAK